MKLTPITNPVALRLDTTVGTRIFAGDTMIHGDTGMREISSLATYENITSGKILIRRLGETVFMYLRNVQFGESTGGVGSLPIGFRGEPFPKVGVTMSGSWPLADGTFAVSTVGYINFYRVPTDKTVSGLLTYSTHEAWPATLPGLPA